eukprot:5749170-Prymnesium_polylepis.1
MLTKSRGHAIREMVTAAQGGIMTRAPGTHARAHLDVRIARGRAEQKVLRLEVAVADARAVHMLQRLRNLAHEDRRVVLREGPVVADPVEDCSRAYGWHELGCIRSMRNARAHGTLALRTRRRARARARRTLAARDEVEEDAPRVGRLERVDHADD